LDVEKRFETLGERFLDAIAFQVADSSPPVVWGFKIVQWIAYVTLFGLLIFALCGEDAWRAALDAPGYGSVFRLLLSLIHALFSSKGLAALGSYTLVNLFLGVWFFRRYRRRLLRSAQKRMVSLRISLLEIWKESLTEIATDLKASAEEIRLRRSVISPLRGNDHGEP
jgi:hypothetical protein